MPFQQTESRNGTTVINDALERKKKKVRAIDYGLYRTTATDFR
jgi:hypothetical protein